MNNRNTARYAAAVAVLTVPAAVSGQAPTIRVRADHVVRPVSPLLTGVCIEDVNHEIYGGLYSQMLYGESFQEPPPAPAIAGFTVYGGRWTARDGVVRIDGQDGPKLVSSHRPFLDGTVSVDLMFSGQTGGNAGLIVRTTSPGVGADVFTGYEVALDAARQTVILARHRNNFEPISSAPCQVPLGKWTRMEVKLAGPGIEISVDGKLVLRYDDGANALPAGTVALRAWQREASFRNLVVRSETSDPTPFVEDAEGPAVSGMWRVLTRGEARAHWAIETEAPFTGAQSQRLAFATGKGEWGIENLGLNRWGLSLVAGKPYEGVVWARSAETVTLFAALESRDGSKAYAEKPLRLAGGDWRKLTFTLTPAATDTAARFALKLKAPGNVTLGYAFLQPGKWGRYKGLPVRRDVVEGLVRQGVTVMRYGGSMVNAPGYRWKNMVGPRDRRPPYRGTWYPWASNGWGIIDFMDVCEAAGVEYVPDLNSFETPQDMADFVEYARAPAGSEWGRRRAADGHPAPYDLKYIELGNEERVDDRYADRFEALAKAIWARDPSVILIVGDFLYRQPIRDPFRFEGAASGITTLAAHQRILRLAKEHNREVWFDVHVGTEQPVNRNDELEGMLSFTDALERIADGAKHRVVVFEYNAGNHAQKRALANVIATNAIERDGRIPIVTSANGLQPDGQNDNGWDQGLLFLNPSRVWLQPPGYALQMLSRSRLSHLAECEVDGSGLDAVAMRSDDGRAVTLQVANPGPDAVTAAISLSGFVLQRPQARVSTLAAPLDAVNTAKNPDAVTPKESRWTHGLKDEPANYTFQPHSFTVLRFD